MNNEADRGPRVGESLGGPEQVPEVPEIDEEQQQGNDRATVWYVLGSEQMSILRTVLMEQEPDTLDAWYDEALTLQKEIRRVRAWHAAGLDE